MYYVRYFWNFEYFVSVVTLYILLVVGEGYFLKIDKQFLCSWYMLKKLWNVKRFCLVVQERLKSYQQTQNLAKWYNLPDKDRKTLNKFANKCLERMVYYKTTKQKFAYAN